jgi:ribonuclease BN (tRNA processing enzyme)
MANVKTLALFHHSPDAVDSDLDALAAQWERHTAPKVIVAKEGLVVDLEG